MAQPHCVAMTYVYFNILRKVKVKANVHAGVIFVYYALHNPVKMVKMSRDMKRRVSTVAWIAKTAFHWGFIPTVLYLGRQHVSVGVHSYGDAKLCGQCWRRIYSGRGGGLP